MIQNDYLGFDLAERWGEIFPQRFSLAQKECPVFGDIIAPDQRCIGRIDFVVDYDSRKYIIESKLGGVFSVFDMGEAVIYKSAFAIDRRIQNTKTRLVPCVIFPLSYLSLRVKVILITAQIEYIAIGIDHYDDEVMVTINSSIWQKKWTRRLDVARENRERAKFSVLNLPSA